MKNRQQAPTGTTAEAIMIVGFDVASPDDARAESVGSNDGIKVAMEGPPTSTKGRKVDGLIVGSHEE